MDNVNACVSELQETTDSEDYSTDVSDDKLCKEGESESLSDIDDAEVGSYLNNEKEKNFKKIIWEMMNGKYLQEQAAKRAAAAAGGVTNPKKELRHKRATGVKKTHSAAKTAHPTSPKKRPHSKINYDALSKALDEPSPSDNPPKRRREPADKIVGESSVGTQVNEEATDETQEEENGWEDNPNYSNYNNQEEEYNYYDDDEFF